jgi:hypothetical protein
VERLSGCDALTGEIDGFAGVLTMLPECNIVLKTGRKVFVYIVTRPHLVIVFQHTGIRPGAGSDVTKELFAFNNRVLERFR